MGFRRFCEMHVPICAYASAAPMFVARNRAQTWRYARPASCGRAMDPKARVTAVTVQPGTPRLPAAIERSARADSAAFGVRLGGSVAVDNGAVGVLMAAARHHALLHGLVAATMR